ncbi:hypothetical protein M2280_004053 [Prescottella agglutinans]|uniref:Uncharacterized protein n=1 Tax=Prescottella agglutinans TaxID=1644129 RepID=A0ABT6MG95_9NOCA|nr:hypothetical protein [Prescottella agglutinans]
MGLVDDIRNASVKRVIPCKTGVWFSEQPEEVRQAAEKYLADGLPASELHRNCVRYGCPASETTFRAHCHRRCSCYIGGDK